MIPITAAMLQARQNKATQTICLCVIIALLLFHYFFNNHQSLLKKVCMHSIARRTFGGARIINECAAPKGRGARIRMRSMPSIPLQFLQGSGRAGDTKTCEMHINSNRYETRKLFVHSLSICTGETYLRELKRSHRKCI